MPVLLILLIFVLLPSLVSTDWGKNQILSLVNKSIPGEIRIQSIQLGWFSGQKLVGAVLTDANNQNVAEIEELYSEASLWQLLIVRSLKLGHTKLLNLNAHLAFDENGNSNINLALGLNSKKFISLTHPSSIELTNVTGDLDLFSKDLPLSLKFSGKTQYDNKKGFFDIGISLNKSQAHNWNDLSAEAGNLFASESSNKAVLYADIDHFPVAIFDHLIALTHPNETSLATSLIGNEIDVG